MTDGPGKVREQVVVYLTQRDGELLERLSDDPVPPDLSERPDHYLYEGGYERWVDERRRKGAWAPCVCSSVPGPCWR